MNYYLNDVSQDVFRKNAQQSYGNTCILKAYSIPVFLLSFDEEEKEIKRE